MSSTITRQPRSWVTGAIQRFRGVFARPPLSNRALRVLDMVDEATASVYETQDYDSYAVDRRGVVAQVTAQIDQLQAHGCVVAGDWYRIGRAARRDWMVTAQGAVVLAEMWRDRKPSAIESAEAWAETTGGVL